MSNTQTDSPRNPLGAKGVGSRPFFYPMHLQPVFSGCRVRGGGGYTFNRVFSLEGHLNSVSVEKTGADGLGMDSLTWLSVSAVFRFGR